MKMRSRIRNKRTDRKIFKNTASKTHVQNLTGRIMYRGGTRL